MGSSGEDPNKGIDQSVGGLVWVRRRNGSWWPGRILSPEELPEGCVPTPRSGTPVKLLGREDASVDWYNLEKSKRVKAFRCGEYDACIEKAKASASNLSKKAVKYARREDAILHALELENASRHHPEFSPIIPHTQNEEDEQNQHHDDDDEQELPSSSSSQEILESSEEEEDTDEDMSSSEEDSDSGPELSQSGVSFEEPDLLDTIKEDSRRWRTPNDSEDDGTEGVKRMKGLEDLGMGVASSLKRKRSHAHEFLKRKDRRRTLTKVLEYTKMVSVPVVCEHALESNNESKRNNNSDSTGVSCENAFTKRANDASSLVVSKPKENAISGSPDYESSEKLFDVPLVSEEKHSAGFSTIVPCPSQSQSSHVETNESGSTSSGTADIHNNNNITPRIEKGAHEWQLKGKRNSRSRKTDIDDEPETYLDDSNHVKSRPITDWSWNPRESPNAADVAAAPQRLLPYRQSRFTVNPKYEDSDFSLRHHITPSGLYEVVVEVKTSYRPQRVPYISLMSKLNGQPIIGHPLAIEVLDDGFCDDMLVFSECYSSSSELGVDMVYERRSRGKPPTTKNTKSKKNGLLSKKIRKLSSLTGSGGSHRQNQNREEKKLVVEKLKGPSIACVPLKVVFSRINAALSSNSMRAPPRFSRD